MKADLVHDRQLTLRYRLHRLLSAVVCNPRPIRSSSLCDFHAAPKEALEFKRSRRRWSMATRTTVPPARLHVDGSTTRLVEAFRRVPVAAVIRRGEELPRALASQVPAVFFLRAPAFHLGPLVWAVQARGKMAFVHIDLIAGLGKDRAGVAFLAREIGVNGIITSHSALVAAARAERVIAVQRLLLHDDLGLPSALTALDHARPDIVEVLPAVIFPLVVDQIRARLSLPMIVGGFVREQAQREEALQRGALAISTSAAQLWP
jgi:glycerol uptake operon antiterminator